MFNRKPAIQQQIEKAFRLLQRLFSIKIVRYLISIFLVILIVPIVMFFILRPKVQHNINYGITFSKRYAEQIGLDWKYAYIQILDDLDVKNLRLVAYWDESEAIEDTYDFNDVKWQLDEAKKRNVKIIMTVGRKVPRYPECFEPEWWKKTEGEDLRNIALYEYVKEAVLALKDYDNITMWQVENEPFWPFGECPIMDRGVVEKEIEVVRNIDNRPILVQDSGEGGVWFLTYQMGDYLGISMYRKIWYNFWGIFLGRFIYFQYPLAHWTYKIKADLVGVPYEKILVTELQAEPWGPAINSELTQEDINETMSHHHFIATIDYAQKAGFKDLYFWGAEWWLFRKDMKGDPFYWNTAKAVINQ